MREKAKYESGANVWKVYSRNEANERYKPRCTIEAGNSDEALRMAKLMVGGELTTVKVVRVMQVTCYHKKNGVVCGYAWNYKGLRQYATCPNCYKQVNIARILKRGRKK